MCILISELSGFFKYIYFVCIKLFLWNYEAPEFRGPGSGEPPEPRLIRHCRELAHPPVMGVQGSRKIWENTGVNLFNLVQRVYLVKIRILNRLLYFGRSIWCHQIIKSRRKIDALLRHCRTWDGICRPCRIGSAALELQQLIKLTGYNYFHFSFKCHGRVLSVEVSRLHVSIYHSWWIKIFKTWIYSAYNLENL